MSRVQCERERDEQVLLRLFRWLHDSERCELIRYAAETLAKRVSLDPSLGRYSEPTAKILADELEDDLDSRLRHAMPPEEPWDYLDDWVDQTISSAWGADTAGVIFGSCAYDQASAEQLLDAVEETAASGGFPEPPYFDTDQMLLFVQHWREEAICALEKNAERYARIAVVDVISTPANLTLFAKARSRQSLYLGKSLAEVEAKLKSDGWSRAGQIARSDNVLVALWSRGNTEYLAVWDEVEQPFQEKGR